MSRLFRNVAVVACAILGQFAPAKAALITIVYGAQVNSIDTRPGFATALPLGLGTQATGTLVYDTNLSAVLRGSTSNTAFYDSNVIQQGLVFNNPAGNFALFSGSGNVTVADGAATPSSPPNNFIDQYVFSSNSNPPRSVNSDLLNVGGQYRLTQIDFGFVELGPNPAALTLVNDLLHKDDPTSFILAAIASGRGFANLRFADLRNPTAALFSVRMNILGASFSIENGTSVPEPASMLLLSVGLLGLGVARRQSRA